MAEKIEFKIEKHVGVLSENPKTGWKKELNLISWSGRPEKFDIREWNDTHDKMGKGITFTSEEAAALSKMLQGEV